MIGELERICSVILLGVVAACGSEAAEAHRALEARETTGSTVLTIG